ncbi:DUF1849 family protein [Rickettsiales bacterium]|nr:DUF1849 family protein [Rickettsiales bacterium]
MKKIVNLPILIFSLIFVEDKNVVSKEKELLSYQSVYEIALDKDRDMKNTLGKSYIKDANGELLLDWYDNCSSWASNQRMYISFINSSGVGTISDINYSLKEDYDGSKMDFALQVKENNMIIEQFSGSGKKNKKTLINLISPVEKKLEFPKDVIFPHEHLKMIINKLGNSKDIFSNKVYEGTIPSNYIEISTFIHAEKINENQINLPKEIQKDFWSVRMAYYKDSNQTPEMEMSARMNKQGVVSFFRYDYPNYSLDIKLKKIQVIPKNCN